MNLFEQLWNNCGVEEIIVPMIYEGGSKVGKDLSLKRIATDTTIALIWRKRSFEEAVVYQIFCDGVLKGTIKSTNYTLKGLQASTEYEISVEAVTLDGRVLAIIGKDKIATRKEPETVSVLDYGAVGDGKFLNTIPIQAAIDDCPEYGRVVIPEGIYVTGALHLKSHMTLEIQKNAVLLGSAELIDYPIKKYRFEGLETECYSSLLNAGILNKHQQIEDLMIEGEGVIDANGSILRQKERDERAGQTGRAVCIRNAKNVYIHGLTIKHSPAWCVHLIYSEYVCINDVRIFTKTDENGVPYTGIANADGIDVDSSRHIDIIHSVIASQDACVSVKSGRNAEGREIAKPSEHVRVTDCLLKAGLGIAIGSEMSGGIRDVVIRDCVFQNTFSLLSIKAPRPRGGVVEDVLCEDCIHFNYDTLYEDSEWFRGAIYVDQFYSFKEFDSELKKPVTEATPCVKDLVFRNVEVDTVAGNAIYLVGLPEMPIKNVTLDHVKAKGKNGIVMRNVEGLEQKNVSIILHR